MVNEHPKYYNEDGMEVPSVTTILKLLNTNLDGWHNYMGLKHINTKYYVNDLAIIGTIVHSIFERLCKGIIKPGTRYLGTNDELQYIDQATIDQYVKRMNDLLTTFDTDHDEIYANEMKIVGNRYAGTLDILLHNKDDDYYTLLDLKTSKAVYKKMWLQLAGYAKLLEEVHSIKIKYCGIILIKKDLCDKDFITTKPTDTSEFETNINIFEHLMEMYHLFTPSELKALGVNN